MNHYDIGIGSVYNSPSGQYVVTSATAYRAHTSVTLAPVSEQGSSFTTTIVDMSGPRAWAWGMN